MLKHNDIHTRTYKQANLAKLTCFFFNKAPDWNVCPFRWNEEDTAGTQILFSTVGDMFTLEVIKDILWRACKSKSLHLSSWDSGHYLAGLEKKRNSSRAKSCSCWPMALSYTDFFQQGFRLKRLPFVCWNEEEDTAGAQILFSTLGDMFTLEVIKDILWRPAE